jgi:hypothetical protein
MDIPICGYPFLLSTRKSGDKEEKTHKKHIKREGECNTDVFPIKKHHLWLTIAKKLH